MTSQEQLPKAISDLLLESKGAAKQKNYDAALKAVNEALKIADKTKTPPRQIISLLDYRHAIHVRKDDLDASLKDAKSMIRLDRKDARGYIRCGTVERLRNNFPAALKYLEHGLENVAASDPNLALLSDELKTTRNQMSAELVVSRAKDPLTTLPLEIIELVMSYIDYRQNVQMLRVSRSWKRLLSELRPLTEILAFPGSQKPVSPKMLLSALRRLKVPKAVKVTNLSLPAADILAGRLQRSQAFRTLQSFEINDLSIQVQALPITQWNLKTIVIDAATSCNAEFIRRVLQSCSNLQVAKFCNIRGRCEILELHSESLRELEIAHSAGSGPSFADSNQKIALNLPRIEKLSFQTTICGHEDVLKPLDLLHMERLHSLKLHRCFLTNILLPASIKHLEMTYCIFLHAEGAVAGQPPGSFTTLDNLETLSMLESDTMGTNGESYPQFIRHAVSQTKPGTLSSLSLAQTRSWPEGFTTMMASPWFQQLTYLRIEGGSTIKDQHSQVLLESCPDLEKLHISAASITGAFLSDLVKAPTSKLRSIKLDKCEKVSSDVFPWARERGVDVSYVTSITNHTGCRVREQH